MLNVKRNADDLMLKAFLANIFNPVGADSLFTIANLLITSVFHAKTQALAGGVFNTISQVSHADDKLSPLEIKRGCTTPLLLLIRVSTDRQVRGPRSSRSHRSRSNAKVELRGQAESGGFAGGLQGYVLVLFCVDCCCCSVECLGVEGDREGGT